MIKRLLRWWRWHMREGTRKLANDQTAPAALREEARRMLEQSR